MSWREGGWGRREASQGIGWMKTANIFQALKSMVIDQRRKAWVGRIFKVH
jgi:hypothetical protein